MKTRKTLVKRIRITKTGKIMKKKNNAGHLKRKWTANKRFRKNRSEAVTAVGYKKLFKKMLGKAGRNISV